MSTLGQNHSHTKGEVVKDFDFRLEQFAEWENSIPANLANFLPENMYTQIPVFYPKKTSKAIPGKIIVLETKGVKSELLFIGKELPLEGVLPCNDLGREVFGRKVGDSFSFTYHDPSENNKKKKVLIAINEIKDPSPEFLAKIANPPSNPPSRKPKMEVFPFQLPPKS
jgi:hypothetical protein